MLDTVPKRKWNLCIRSQHFIFVTQKCTETKPIWGITFILSTQVLEKTQEFPENTVFLKEKKIKGKP